MRDVLLKRIKPQVEAFAAELVELFASRFDAELAKLPGLLEVALSAAAFQPEPEVIDADANPRHRSPVSNVPRSAKRGLHRDKGRRPDDGGKLPAAAPAPHPRREEDQRAPRLVEPAPRPQQLPSQKKCSKCGFIGGNARGCGTSHKTQIGSAILIAVEPALRASQSAHRERFAPTGKLPTGCTPKVARPALAEVAAAKERIARRDAIKARSGGVVVTPSRRVPVVWS